MRSAHSSSAVIAGAIRDPGPSKNEPKDLAQLKRDGRAVEQKLRESEERYRMLLDGVQDHAIFMLDPLGKILSWNAGAERIKGYKADAIIGRSFACFFPAEAIKRGRPQEVLRITEKTGRHEEQSMRVRKEWFPDPKLSVH